MIADELVLEGDSQKNSRALGPLRCEINGSFAEVTSGVYFTKILQVQIFATISSTVKFFVGQVTLDTIFVCVFFLLPFYCFWIVLVSC